MCVYLGNGKNESTASRIKRVRSLTYACGRCCVCVCVCVYACMYARDCYSLLLSDHQLYLDKNPGGYCSHKVVSRVQTHVRVRERKLERVFERDGEK
jgi:hypothetical protein